jgi:hypothetical protein
MHPSVLINIASTFFSITNGHNMYSVSQKVVEYRVLVSVIKSSNESLPVPG